MYQNFIRLYKPNDKNTALSKLKKKNSAYNSNVAQMIKFMYDKYDIKHCW